MAQYRDFNTTFRVTDDNVIITSQMGINQQTDTVDRDGSFETNFKAAVWNHLQTVLDLAPSSTSPSCTVTTPGRWRQATASGTVSSGATIIRVPSGNSGNLVLYCDTGTTMYYKKNAGSYTSFTD